MDFSRIDARLLAHPGARKALQPAWGWMCYWVGRKQFACEFTAGADAKAPYAGRHLLSLKCDPDWSAALRATYPDAVLPGYYSDGRTWISIDLDRVNALSSVDSSQRGESALASDRSLPTEPAHSNVELTEGDPVGAASRAVLPCDLVLELCDQSYRLVFAKLTKRQQREVLAAR